jgi:hypothetical protein
MDNQKGTYINRHEPLKESHREGNAVRVCRFDGVRRDWKVTPPVNVDDIVPLCIENLKETGWGYDSKPFEETDICFIEFYENNIAKHLYFRLSPEEEKLRYACDEGGNHPSLYQTVIASYFECGVVSERDAPTNSLVRE